jgi:hypothetical protein
LGLVFLTLVTVVVIRKFLPNAFLNIRFSPVEIVCGDPSVVRETVIRLVRQSADYELTGMCCINMDAIFEVRTDLLKEAGV